MAKAETLHVIAWSSSAPLGGRFCPAQKILAQDDKEITIDDLTKSESQDTKLACPYFMPVAKLENGSWPHPARLPLGGGWTGNCTAPQHQNETPAKDVLERFCNIGYASGCAWAPPDRKWDAVRFAITAQSDLPVRGKNNSSSVIHLCYVCERDHRPVECGDLEFDVQQCRWPKQHEDPRVQRMAECFLKARLNRKD